MKKRFIPAIITLTAGLIDCLLTVGRGMTNVEFVRQLLIVLVIFFILGLLVRFLVEKGLQLLEDKEKNKVDEAGQEQSEPEQDDNPDKEE